MRMDRSSERMAYSTRLRMQADSVDDKTAVRFFVRLFLR